MSRFPDFYVVGAAKAGTTSLWNYLRDHPQIHLGPVKEPNFFAFGPEGPNVIGPAPPDELHARLHVDTVVDEQEYRRLFAGAAADQVTGEASVRYLYKPEAAARIATARPDARIVIMLREPVARLRSHYTMNRSWGLEDLDLDAALAAEDERVDAGWGWDWHYARLGLYADQVMRYLDTFGSEQVLVVGYGEFSSSPVDVVQRVCRHIGVDDAYVPDTSIRAKQAYVPKSARVDSLRRLIGRFDALIPTALRRRAGRLLRSMNHQPTEETSDESLSALQQRFRSDLERLEAIVGRPQPWVE